MKYEYDRPVRSHETKIVRKPCLKGTLEIVELYKYGELAMTVFTLESMASVLDIPLTTINGRYNRSGLRHWNRPVSAGFGRPRRAFDIDDLRDVVTVLTERNATITQYTGVDGSDKDSKRSSLRTGVTMDPHPTYGKLEATQMDGVNYFTIPALAAYFGLSETTVRNRLRRSGLHRRMKSLGSTGFGGRPRKGVPESMLGDVKLALHNGVKFTNELDRMAAAPMRLVAKEEVARDVITPAIGKLTRHDAAADRLALAVNGVNQNVARKLPPVDDLYGEGGVAGFVTDLENILIESERANRERAVKAEDPPVDDVVHIPAARSGGSVVVREDGAVIDTTIDPWSTEPGEHAQTAVEAARVGLTAPGRPPTEENMQAAMDNMKWGGATRDQALAAMIYVRKHWGMP